MEAMTFKEIMHVSIVLPILLGMSIICTMVAIERWIYFLMHARVSGRMLERVRLDLKHGKLHEAKHEALKSKGLVSQAIAAQIDAVNLPRNERESLVLYYHQ